ncbi:hypothetical protein [Streptomyces sp. ODS05-4]|nr:hypothetical protein [Streptomyces sp. ODS05-4]
MSRGSDWALALVDPVCEEAKGREAFECLLGGHLLAALAQSRA